MAGSTSRWQPANAVRARKLLIATGVVDSLPDIPGFRELYGRSVFHCPYCDGWEYATSRSRSTAAARAGYGLSLELTAWSRDLVLCTDGPSEIDDRQTRAGWSATAFALREERVARSRGTDGVLEHVVFESASGWPAARCSSPPASRSGPILSMHLGCEINDKGTVRTGKYESHPPPRPVRRRRRLPRRAVGGRRRRRRRRGGVRHQHRL